MMLRTPVCSYPIIVTHLSFNFLCLLVLYSIYLNGIYSKFSLGTGEVREKVEGQQFTSTTSIVPSPMGATTVHKLGRNTNYEYIQSIKSVNHNAAKSVNWSILKKSQHIGFGIVHSSMLYYSIYRIKNRILLLLY
jgi:hypothetical protein